MDCLFVSDLHGKKDRYRKLFEIINERKPDSVLIGGDLLPLDIRLKSKVKQFFENNLFKKIRDIKNESKEKINFYIIMGNDDPKIYEKYLLGAQKGGLINYINNRSVKSNDIYITGYSYIPPSPFQLKDWEKYDVSRYVDIGAISPEKGGRSVKIPDNEIKYSTIKKDLERLVKKSPPERTIYLFHSPPYETNLDRADLDGKKIDHVPIDIHVGSIAIKRFIKEKQPLLTLHGHVHETVEMTGSWKERIGDTYCFTAAHNGPELAVIEFNTDDLDKAERLLV